MQPEAAGPRPIKRSGQESQPLGEFGPVSASRQEPGRKVQRDNRECYKLEKTV